MKKELEPLIIKQTDNIIESLDTLKKIVILFNIPEDLSIIDDIDASINEIDLFKAFYEIYK